MSVLMAVGFTATLVLLPSILTSERRSSILDPIRALEHCGLLTLGLTALCYNLGFLTLLAYNPFPLRLDAHGLGLVFFGWGVTLAIASVFLAPRLQARFGMLPTMYSMLAFRALDLARMGFGVDSRVVLAVAVMVGGTFLGVNNTVITTAVLQAAPVERPVASAVSSFIRFVGGAATPFLTGLLSEMFSPGIPFYAGAISVALSIVVLISGRAYLQ